MPKTSTALTVFHTVAVLAWAVLKSITESYIVEL